MFITRKKMEEIKECVQKQKLCMVEGATNYDIGFYNGMETVLSILENRKALYEPIRTMSAPGPVRKCNGRIPGGKRVVK